MRQRRFRRRSAADRGPLPPWADEQARLEGEYAQAYAVQEMRKFDRAPASLRRVTCATNRLDVAQRFLAQGARTFDQVENLVREVLTKRSESGR